MTFRLQHASFDQIPEEQRALFVADVDGTWRLDIDVSEIEGLKRALKAERRLRQQAERTIWRLTNSEGARALVAFPGGIPGDAAKVMGNRDGD